MARWTVGIILGVVALAVAAPVLVVLFIVPLWAEKGPGLGNNNQVPSDLHALTVHDRLAIQLTWTAVDQGTATYVLQRSEGGGEDSWEAVAELRPGATSYLDQEGLRDGVTYLYRIYAWDPDGGSGYSNTTSATATALPQPGNHPPGSLPGSLPGARSLCLGGGQVANLPFVTTLKQTESPALQGRDLTRPATPT